VHLDESGVNAPTLKCPPDGPGEAPENPEIQA
jgi:hypothetical protein